MIDMIRIYCQYSIGGFKVFNVSAFKNNESGLTYVRMPEITEAKNSDSQNLLVTRICNCGLDPRIIRLFSSGDISLMILDDCGPNRKDTTLFISPVTSKTSYAFVSDDKQDRSLFAKMASLWIESDSLRTMLSKRLSELVSEKVIGDEVTFAFDTDKWSSLINDLSKVPILPKLMSVITSEKNLMVYNRPNKKEILKSTGVNLPVTSFLNIPGNEVLRKAERKKQALSYVIITAGVLIAFSIASSLLSYCSNNG